MPPAPDSSPPPDCRRPEAEAASHTADAPNFEAALGELNELVSRLESGALGLSESIAAYERGVGLVRQLHEQLTDVEERVRMLVRIDPDGRPILEPTTAEALGRERPEQAMAGTDPDAAPRRGGRGSRAARPKRLLPGMDDSGGDPRPASE